MCVEGCGNACDCKNNVESEVAEMKVGLSDRSIGVIVLCLQKALIEQVDITNLFRELAFQLDADNKLEVINPPKDLNINMCPEIESESIPTEMTANGTLPN